MPPCFKHHDLALLNPTFDSPLVDVITNLDYLRRLQLHGTHPRPNLFSIKAHFSYARKLRFGTY